MAIYFDAAQVVARVNDDREFRLREVLDWDGAAGYGVGVLGGAGGRGRALVVRGCWGK